VSFPHASPAACSRGHAPRAEGGACVGCGRARASRKKLDRGDRAQRRAHHRGLAPWTWQKPRRCVRSGREVQKKEPGTPLPGPLLPATPRVSRWCAARFCLVVNFVLTSENHRFFPPTRQNSPNDFFVPCAEKRSPSADNPLFVSVNHHEQDIICSRSTLHPPAWPCALLDHRGSHRARQTRHRGVYGALLALLLTVCLTS
jgi:hypothetical protein